MKKRTISVILCALMLMYAVAICVSADSADKHSLTGTALLDAYNLVSVDGEDGVVEANIVDGKLVLKWGESSSYPLVFFKSTVIPENLTNYTVSADLITVDDTTNKRNSLLYGRHALPLEGEVDKIGNYGEIGFRTGVAGSGNLGAICLYYMGVPASNLFIGQGDYADLSNVHPATHTFKATVVSNGTEAATISLWIDGKAISVTNDKALLASVVGFTGWKNERIALDNIKVVNEATNTTLVDIDFEDHTPGATLTYVDEESHGYVCACGVAEEAPHNWNAGVDDTSISACGTEKAQKYTCTLCGGTKIVSAHVAGDEEIKDPTCLEDGYKRKVCTKCNEVLEFEAITATGHTWGLWSITKAATETEEGERQRTCEVCNEIDKKAIEKREAEETTTTQAPAADTTTQAPKNENKNCGGINIFAASAASVVALFGTALTIVTKKRQ